jgi:uncharacterized membrane protein YdbT with pleckstrin-like domain
MAEETINQSVNAGGAIIKTMHPHPFAYLVYYLGGLFIGVAGYWYGLIYAIVGVFVLVVSEVMRRSETFTIFEEGVSRNFTMLSRSQVFTGYNMIRSVMVTQSVVERLLGLGTITLITSDTEEGKIQFGGVKDAFAVGEVIQSHLV